MKSQRKYKTYFILGSIHGKGIKLLAYTWLLLLFIASVICELKGKGKGKGKGNAKVISLGESTDKLLAIVA